MLNINDLIAGDLAPVIPQGDKVYSGYEIDGENLCNKKRNAKLRAESVNTDH